MAHSEGQTRTTTHENIGEIKTEGFRSHLELQRWAGWSGFGSRERKSRVGEGKSGIKGGQGGFFYFKRLGLLQEWFQ